MTRINSALSALRSSALRRRLREQGEEGVALLTAILFMILAAGLSVVLLSVILSQATPVFIAQKNTRTIYAAQAGVQASLGVIRSLSTTDAGKTVGYRAKLPCSISGKVDGNDAASTYSVTLKYFTVDPTGKDTPWQDANDMNCTGTVLSGTVQPLYALALADGLGAAVPGKADASYGNRYISAVYKFKVTNVNVPGGRIWDYNLNYCLEAVSVAVGSQVKFKKATDCTTASDTKQLWTYDTDYEIKLASTVASTTPLCISSPTDKTDITKATTAKAGPAVLAVCRSDNYRWNELWSWFGTNSWGGQLADNSNYSTFYLNSGTPSDGSLLNVTNGSGGSGFAPTTAVGAGAASHATNQIVNYKEFGRCADVTDTNINSSFMISYPCKQDPTGTGKLDWNHKWYYTEPTAPATSVANQPVYVYLNNNSSQKYCLTAPNASGKYVTFTSCNSTVSTAQKWTRFQDTGNYPGSYLFTDNLGRCLAVDSTDTYTTGKWSKMIVTVCNGGLEQKWNSPASYTGSDVSGYKEYSK
ncbi:RICIN domain-containing protein [Frigoribacterium sp. UYMn621]|uniref:RICIN domain-containing protein n=1 Tax=Frigoribacterium sp. UYMn621 TaxID=3156343 RepID=UPI003399528B